MAKTRTDIVVAALKKMGVLAAHETADASDFALVGDIYDSLHAVLVSEEIAFWDSNSVPVNAFLNVRTLVAAEAATEFMTPPRLRAELQREAIVSRQALRALRDRQSKDIHVRVEYF